MCDGKAFGGRPGQHCAVALSAAGNAVSALPAAAAPSNVPGGPEELNFMECIV